MNIPLGGWLSRYRVGLRRAWKTYPRQTAVIATAMVMGVALTGAGVAALSGSGTESGGERLASQGSKGRSASTTSTPGSLDTTSTSTAGSTALGGRATVTTSPEAQRVAIAATKAAGGFTAQTSNGLALMVTPDKKVSKPGEAVSFDAMVKDVDGAVTALRWDFGDGTVVSADTKSCADPANRASVEAGAADFATTMSHVYDSPGEYQVTVTASTGSRCGAEAPSDSVVAVGKVVVEGPRIANGTANPNAKIALTGNTPEDPVLGVSITAGDADGYVTKVVIDWDDGSGPSVFSYPLSACVEAGGPPSSSRTESAEHTYLVPGSYDVTATVTSTGCDGSQTQQGIDVSTGINVGGLNVAGVIDSATSKLP